MRRRESRQIGELLNDFIKESGLDKGLLRVRVVEAWREVVGEKIDRYVEEQFFKEGLLISKISSSVVRNQLFINREDILKRINSLLGGEVVKSLILK